MPIYEYGCRQCGHVFDVLQKMSDAAPAACPACSAAEPRRLVSAPSFRLKGKGWYETDFKKDKDRKRWLAEPDAQSAGSDRGGKDADAAKPKVGHTLDGGGGSKHDHKHDHKHDQKPRHEPKHEPKHDHSHGHGHGHSHGHKHEH